MINKIIAICAIVDDLLKARGHQDDIRCLMTDAEILTIAFVAAMFFGGNHKLVCQYMKDHSLVNYMLDKSRFNRRIHRLSMLINDLFHQVGMILKESNDSIEYLIDSFPVHMRNNTCIFNVKLVKSEEFRGYIASKKLYFLWCSSSIINN